MTIKCKEALYGILQLREFSEGERQTREECGYHTRKCGSAQLIEEKFAGLPQLELVCSHWASRKQPSGVLVAAGDQQRVVWVCRGSGALMEPSRLRVSWGGEVCRGSQGAGVGRRLWRGWFPS